MEWVTAMPLSNSSCLNQLVEVFGKRIRERKKTRKGEEKREAEPVIRDQRRHAQASLKGSVCVCVLGWPTVIVCQGHRTFSVKTRTVQGKQRQLVTLSVYMSICVKGVLLDKIS